jgi:hypothetical protein
MRKYAIILAILVLALAACEDEPPPTQVYIVLSPTPDDSAPDATEAVTEAVDQVDTPTVEQVTDIPATVEQPTDTLVPSEPPDQPTATRRATRTPRPPTRTPLPASPTPIPDIFPTNTVAEVQIAEQVFEHGRMFWIRHSRQIWVMLATGDDPSNGDWFCYNDTFEEGEMEIDPDLIPPEGLFQPRRGFGKLWREHPDIKDGLGWAITPEFELTSNYTYLPGGYVQNNQYFPGPGEHRLTTLYNETISFFEGEIRGDCQGGTWRMAPSQ